MTQHFFSLSNDRWSAYVAQCTTPRKKSNTNSTPINSKDSIFSAVTQLKLFFVSEL